MSRYKRGLGGLGDSGFRLRFVTCAGTAVAFTDMSAGKTTLIVSALLSTSGQTGEFRLIAWQRPARFPCFWIMLI